MASLSLLLLVPPALLVILVVALVSRRRPLPSGRLEDVDRVTRRWRIGGIAVGLAAAAATVPLGLGLGLLLAAPVLVLGVLAGVVGGEIRVSAPAETTRTAPLEVRRPADYLPRALTGVVVSCLGYLFTLLAITTAMGSADDLGRAGRRLALECSAFLGEARTPWPGSFYSVPLLAVVAGGLIAAAIALHRIVRRPRQGADVVQDDALRREAAEAVVAAVGLLAVVPLGGVIAISAMALGGFSCGPAAWEAAAVALPVTIPLLGAVGVWCVAVLLRGARGRARAAAAEAELR